MVNQYQCFQYHTKLDGVHVARNQFSRTVTLENGKLRCILAMTECTGIVRDM